MLTLKVYNNCIFFTTRFGHFSYRYRSFRYVLNSV